MNLKFLSSVLFILASTYCSTIIAKNTDFNYETAEDGYRYSVIPTGENYTFKFEKNPDGNSAKIKAGRDVLLSIYKDTSIYKKPTESYIKERARCHVFDSHFHTYSLCFLPNDFSNKNKDRFWGFVTQMPNWKWLATRFLLPVLLAYACFFYFTRRKKS